MKLNIGHRLFVFIVIFLSSCTSQITRFDDPTNTYNAQTTYQKLLPKYPFIKIAGVDVPSSVVEIKNLTYVSYGNRALQLDLYKPKKTAKPAPLIIFVHCGGWMHGYRENFTPMAIRLAEKGYVAATISYRLSPEAKYPAAIYDQKAAVRWLRAHAKTYGINSEKIVIAGGSAGGQMAELVGVTNGFAYFDPQATTSKITSDVAAIINIDGLSDFTLPAALKYENDPNKKPSAAERWFGGRYEDVPQLWKEASPINYVNANTPPILFIGSAQERFSVGRTEMIAAMSKTNRYTELVLLPDSPHSFWMFEPWLTPSVTAIDSFLRKVL